ncbi:MAG: ABC transporter ATP-binding protein [Saprospiraceae bacterium]
MKYFWYIINRLKPYKGWLTLSIISNMLMSVFTIASIPIFIPFFELLFSNDKLQKSYSVLPSGASLNEYLNYYLSKLIYGKTPSEALVFVILAFFISFLFKNIFVYLGNFFITPVRNGFIKDLRSDIYSHLIKLPVIFFKDRKKGDLLSRMSIDMQEIEGSIMNGFDALVKAPLIIIGAIIFMLIVSPKLTVFVLILLPFTVFLIGGVSRKMKQQSNVAQIQLGKLLTIMDESINSIKVIKSFNASNTFIKRFNNINGDYKNLLDRILWRKALGSPLAEIMGVLVISLLMWFAATLVFNGELMPATFIAFIYAFFSIIEPAKSFSSAYYSFQKGAAALDRVNEILNEKNDIVDSVDSISKTDFVDSIKLKNVNFKYPDSDEYVLKNINLTIEKGHKIALIGLSGSGKTTLVDLISRFYNITSGEILIDDVNINNIKLADLRELIGMVSQDSLLFNDTAANNILFSDTNIDNERMKFAVKSAVVDEFIPDFEKLNSVVIGDQGTKLSGGQKQRIAIARAIYKNAPILILDEATSALDSKSEKKVQSALEKVMENKTSIIIAHRLSTIQNVDKVVVIENGEIIEAGKPEDLYELKGAYYKFIQLQQI